MINTCIAYENARAVHVCTMHIVLYTIWGYWFDISASAVRFTQLITTILVSFLYYCPNLTECSFICGQKSLKIRWAFS